MNYLGEILLISILLFVTYQDFRFRAISIWTLPLIVIAAIFLNLSITSTKILFTNTLINILFLAFQLLLVTIYFSLKHKKLTNIINSYMGSGDILFIASIAFMFSPLLFIVFLICGLIVVGAFHCIFKLAINYKATTIPLAGGLSLMLAALWSVKIICNLKQVYSIAEIENLIIR